VPGKFLGRPTECADAAFVRLRSREDPQPSFPSGFLEGEDLRGTVGASIFGQVEAVSLPSNLPSKYIRS
jgi:hypothetical protein